MFRAHTVGFWKAEYFGYCVSRGGLHHATHEVFLPTWKCRSEPTLERRPGVPARHVPQGITQEGTWACSVPSSRLLHPGRSSNWSHAIWQRMASHQAPLLPPVWLFALSSHPDPRSLHPVRFHRASCLTASILPAGVWSLSNPPLPTAAASDGGALLLGLEVRPRLVPAPLSALDTRDLFFDPLNRPRPPLAPNPAARYRRCHPRVSQRRPWARCRGFPTVSVVCIPLFPRIWQLSAAPGVVLPRPICPAKMMGGPPVPFPSCGAATAVRKGGKRTPSSNACWTPRIHIVRTAPPTRRRHLLGTPRRQARVRSPITGSSSEGSPCSWFRWSAVAHRGAEEGFASKRPTDPESREPDPAPGGSGGGVPDLLFSTPPNRSVLLPC